MPKTNITNRQLLSYWNEIQNWYRQGSILSVFFRSKIQEFERLNQLRINMTIHRSREIETSYFQHEVLKDDNIKFVTTKNEQGQDIRVLQEGKLMEDYRKEINEYLSQQVAVEL